MCKYSPKKVHVARHTDKQENPQDAEDVDEKRRQETHGADAQIFQSKKTVVFELGIINPSGPIDLAYSYRSGYLVFVP